ncbi:hypothetical protein GALMADRAFT_139316 [Galerina marginata CBS 339.88]|uniref:F-box domain-containing protein n=1 Tax=Galerina marginata (strain CBS 339.88) TaxID=685588 RepID=A0A067TEB1_GALM3|nr:hypothetical protein GALMADRAFT_139316 [Galerina marginata CBS 339.88]
MNFPKRVKAQALSNQVHVSWPSSSKKKRPTGQKDGKALAKSDSNQQEVQPAAVPLNAKGIAAFPDELLLEIMHYFPDIPLPTIEWKPFDADAHIERREALFSLSQSCSNLRRFFRPYIWNRIEVVSGMRFLRGGRKSDRTINVEILRQLEVVTIRDPRLAQYVEVINVDVRDYSGNTVLAELARCMGEFPNLHTVKIQVLHGPKSESRWSPKDVFNKYSYPQIISVIIPRRLFSLLRSCPRVRTVDWTANTSSLGYNSLVSIMAPWCPHLQNPELALGRHRGRATGHSFNPTAYPST